MERNPASLGVQLDHPVTWGHTGTYRDLVLQGGVGRKAEDLARWKTLCCEMNLSENPMHCGSLWQPVAACSGLGFGSGRAASQAVSRRLPGFEYGSGHVGFVEDNAKVFSE
jgi:hypothetical protein